MQTCAEWSGHLGSSWRELGHLTLGYLKLVRKHLNVVRTPERDPEPRPFPATTRPHVFKMSTHLPIRILRPLHRQRLMRHTESRSFSTTLARPRASTSSKQRRTVDPVQTTAAVRNQMQEGRASSAVYESQLKDDKNLPDDIGLLPGMVHAGSGIPSC